MLFSCTFWEPLLEALRASVVNPEPVFLYETNLWLSEEITGKMDKTYPCCFPSRLGVLLFPQKNKAPLSFHSLRTRVQIMFSSWQTGRVQTTAGIKYLLARGGGLKKRKKPLGALWDYFFLSTDRLVLIRQGGKPMPWSVIDTMASTRIFSG